MKKFLRGWVVNGLSLWVIDLLMDGISFGDGGALLATALLLTLLNMTLKPLLKVLSAPITILTFGFFSMVVNAVVLEAAFALSSGSHIDSFGSALLAGILLAILNSGLNNLFAQK